MNLAERQRRFPLLSKEVLEDDSEYEFDTWVEYEMRAELDRLISDWNRRYSRSLQSYNETFKADVSIGQIMDFVLRHARD